VRCVEDGDVLLLSLCSASALDLRKCRFTLAILLADQCKRNARAATSQTADAGAVQIGAARLQVSIYVSISESTVQALLDAVSVIVSVTDWCCRGVGCSRAACAATLTYVKRWYESSVHTSKVRCVGSYLLT
jgi:hypothetical protein